MNNRYSAKSKVSFIYYFLLVILIGNCNKKANEIAINNIQAHRNYQDSELKDGNIENIVSEYLDIYSKDSTNPYIYYYLSRLDWTQKHQYLTKGLSKFPDDIFLNYCKIQSDESGADNLEKWKIFCDKYPFFNYALPFLMDAYSKEIGKMGNISTIEQFEKMKYYLDSQNFCISKYIGNVKDGKKIKLYGYKSKYYDFSNFEMYNDSTNYGYYTSKESINFEDSLQNVVIARIFLLKYMRLLDIMEFNLTDGFSEPVFVGGNSYDGTAQGKLYFGGRNLKFQKEYPYWTNLDMYLLGRLTDRPNWQLESGSIKDCEIKLDTFATSGKKFISKWLSDNGTNKGDCEIMPFTSDKQKGRFVRYKIYSNKWTVWGYREVNEETFQEFVKLLGDLFQYNDAMSSITEIQQ